MWSKRFWLDALERAIKTGAQVVAVAWPTTAAVLADGANWKVIGITAIGAMGLSFLTSIAGSQIGNPESASVLPTDQP